MRTMAQGKGMYLGLFVWAASLTLAVAQPPTPQFPPLLQKAMERSKKQRFSGSRLVEMKMGPNRVRHTEYVLRDGERTRIEFPDASPFQGQIIVEANGERRHFFPDRNEMHITPPRREDFFMRL